MSAATSAIVAVGVTAAAAAASSVAKNKAAKGAANAREDAVNSLKELNIPDIDTQAKVADESSYTGRLELQKRADPASAEARLKGLEALTANIEGGDATANRFIDQVAAEQQDPELDKLRRKLLATAQEGLDAGANLGPEFQAELVRTGLETAGAAGLAPDRAGAAGQTLRRVTGAAGEVLKEQRRQAAVGNIKAAQDITTTRANILGNLVQQLQQGAAGKTARAATAYQAGAGQLPSAYGLTGADVAGLNIANAELRNDKALSLGNIKAARAQQKGEYISSLIGAGAGVVGGLNTAGVTDKIFGP